MRGQAAFDLALPGSFRRADFLAAPCNAAALAMVEGAAPWANGRLVLAGPPGSGKTHLARIWAAAAGAASMPAADLAEGRVPRLAAAPLALDDADGVAGDPAREAALLHLVNALAAAGRPLLLTAAAPPGAWGLALPDLASRLVASAFARIEPPDDTLLAAVMLKLFADRQVRVDARVIDWLVPRMHRSFAAAQALVAALDARALAEGRGIDIALARAAMAGLAEHGA